METAETARALRSLFRRAGNLAPDLATAVWFYVLLRRQSAAYRAAGRDHRRLEELFESTSDERLLELSGRRLLDVRLTFGPVSASQKLTELLGFLRHAADRTPRRVCEIGTSAGGTLYALTRVAAPDAVIVSVDITIPQTVQTLREKLVKPGQRIVSIEGDSHSDDTKAAVERALEGAPLDVLFIDGDHSYVGVRADFELYAPLVRHGGLIGLHDINEDFTTRKGISTPAISGDVPRFWRELRERHATEELIADPEQDGYGIGVVFP